MKSKISLIPIRIKPAGMHYHLKIKINGKTARMVLDTGASRTVMGSREIVRFTSNQLSDTSLPSAGIGGTNIDSYLCEINEILFGKIEFRKSKVVVMDLQHVNESYQKAGIPKVDGILGNDFLLKCNAIINLPAKNMLIQKNASKRKKK